MEKIKLLAKSSSRNEPYTVTFILDADTLTVRCSCTAGKYGQFCKHKLAFISDDKGMLYNRDSQFEDLKRVGEWIKTTDLPNLVKDLETVEKDLQEAKKSLKSIKNKITGVMRGGI